MVPPKRHRRPQRLPLGPFWNIHGLGNGIRRLLRGILHQLPGGLPALVPGQLPHVLQMPVQVRPLRHSVAHMLFPWVYKVFVQMFDMERIL